MSLSSLLLSPQTLIFLTKNNTGTSVSLVLCQGDSLDIQEIGCIVDHAPNTGSFIWTPAANLVPDGNHNYGLKIIADTGDFQWSDQFGISNFISPSSLPTPSAALTTSEKDVKESANAAKKTSIAVKQASDGQIQEPTGTVEIKKHHTKSVPNTITVYATGESRSHTKYHTSSKDDFARPFATSKHLSAHLVHHESVNATHTRKHQGSSTIPFIIATSLEGSETESANSSAKQSVKELETPITAPSVPTTLPATTVAPSTSLKTSFSAGGAARAAVTGAPLVLGAMAALVL